MEIKAIERNFKKNWLDELERPDMGLFAEVPNPITLQTRKQRPWKEDKLPQAT